MTSPFSSFVRSSTSRAARAEFSPLARRLPSRFSALAAPRRDQPLVGQFWSRGLLDRLQSPLTRYRE